MKVTMIFFITFLSFALYSQQNDTLRLRNTFMYGRYYVLKENNKFDYQYAHCTGVEKGKGTYKKTPFKIKFYFDSVPDLRDTIVKSYNPNIDYISINVLFIKDSSKLDYCSLISSTKSYFLSQDSVYVFGATTDSITVKLYNTVKLFPQKDSCNSYTIYLNEPWNTYVDGEKRHLKKKSNHKYFNKYKGHHANEDKPWRKGKRYRVFDIYEFK